MKTKEEYFGREKMLTDVAFRFLNILSSREARNPKWVSQSKSAWKQSIKIELTIITCISAVKLWNLVANLVICLSSCGRRTKWMGNSWEQRKYLSQKQREAMESDWSRDDGSELHTPFRQQI